MEHEGDLGSLVDLARTGDRAAQDALVRRIQGTVREVIRKRLGKEVRRRVDSEDILQSTLSLALAGLERVEYRGEREFFGWVATVAEHRIANASRRHRAGKRDLGREQGIGDVEGLPAGATSPSAGASREESRVQVRDAVARLPEAERRVVELRSWEGLPFREVARRLGLREEAVARRLYQKALTRLGDLVSE